MNLHQPKSRKLASAQLESLAAELSRKHRPQAGVDVNALVQLVVRESYLDTCEDLRVFADKVRQFNKRKKAIRDYLTALQKVRAEILCAAQKCHLDLCRMTAKDSAKFARILKEHTQVYAVGPLEYELGIPDRVLGRSVTSLASLDSEISRLEQKLATVGDDAQLANIDLQNVLQKQQQVLQMLSTISALVHDSAMAIIRKIGG